MANHKATFDLRTELAQAIEDFIVLDDRITFSKGTDPGDVYRGIAEELIVFGWVVDWPADTDV